MLHTTAICVKLNANKEELIWKRFFKAVTDAQKAKRYHAGTACRQARCYRTGSIKMGNGSYPDGDLLPKIADIFDVSIDNLYGRGEEKCSFEQQVLNHMRAIADSSQDSSAEWLKNYLNIIWAMQLTVWRECRYYYGLPDFKDSNGTIASECTCNTGVTYMRLNKDFRYFTFIEQPESFAKQFSDIDKLSELFRFLGDKMNLKVVMYLLSLDNSEVVGASTIATHLGYPKEKIEKRFSIF